jgi:uncharacterized protein YukE
MQIIMNDAEFDNTIASLNLCANDIEALTAKIDNIMNRLREEWEGASQRAYEAVYEDVKRRVLLPMKELLRSYPVTLKDAKGNIHFKDGETASHITNTYGGIPQLSAVE